MKQLGAGAIVYPEDVDTLRFDWGDVRFVGDPQLAGTELASFGLVELVPGKGHTRHNHPGVDEYIYVVAGEGEQMIDDQPPVRVGPGACMFIPRDVYHGTVNTGSETLRLVVVYAPAGPDRLLREMPGVQVIPAGSSELR